MMISKKFFLYISILPFVVQAGGGRQFLRRNQQQPPACTPAVDNNSSIFVILEWSGSESNKVANEDMILAVNKTFVNAYESEVRCSQEGATRSIKNATIDTNAVAKIIRPEAFTWLVKVDMVCNSCGNDVWQLFNGTGVGLKNNFEPPPCFCAGPNQTSFTTLFRRLFVEEESFGSLSDVTILNVTQIPMLYPEECKSWPTTTYNYTGVCSSRSQRDIEVSQSPTDEPTDFPTDEPTRKPSRKPTRKPSRKPTRKPSRKPTRKPSRRPTRKPTRKPTNTPSSKPSPVPTAKPTPAPVDPTPAPIDQTPAPIDQTPAPVYRTPAPIDQTPAPIVSTPAPVYRTPAPIDQTPAPIDSTPAPVYPTPTPIDLTPAPVVSTPAPVDSTLAPVDQTPAPVVSTPAPSYTTSAPIDQTPAPIDSTPTSVYPTPTPIDQTLAPIDSTPATVYPTPAPIDQTTAPIDSTPAPVDSTPAPIDFTPAPVVSTTPAPVGLTPAPIDPTPAPVVSTPAPVDPTPAPVDQTPAPVVSTRTSPVASGNSSRFLVWDGEEMTVEEAGSESSGNNRDNKMLKEVSIINQEPFAYETDRNICQEVDARLVDNEANRKLCQNYLDLPLVKQVVLDNNGQETCTEIPKVYYSVSKEKEESLTHIGIKANNPEWEHHHYDDEDALRFIQENCGDDVASAYECLAPPAYRADLFRFCVLYTKGGLYMDSDILPLVKLEELYDPCSIATIGHDWPQGKPQKQMKILAGQQGAPIFLCMIHKIVTNVRSRAYPDNPLDLTGPMVLHDCYEENNEGVSITYRDTRDAAYPYSGMRGEGTDGEEIVIAFEIPHHHDSEQHNYRIDFELHEVYRPTCPLHNKREDPNAAKPWSSSKI